MSFRETRTTKENNPIEQTNPPSEYTPFNNAAEHNHKIMGVPNKPVNLRSMPAPLRWFGYFFYSFMVLGVIALIVVYIISRLT